MNEPLTVCNLLLLVVTSLVSVLAFRNPALEERFIFAPDRILAWKQYYRLVHEIHLLFPRSIAKIPPE